MSNNNLFNPPPVIRVFLSSTFADMDKERSYFNEVIVPKISRICSERGVSFFSVDLRWGITKEEQVDGKVLPICLREIDKCRPYFIGIIGNRYGSVLETIPEYVFQSIPWLQGKEGNSITELEMLYAVLDHSTHNMANNSAFYIRSEKLSEELYGNLELEDSITISRLNELKSRISKDESVLSTDYNSIEEFGNVVMRDLLNWLDINFPKAEDVSDVRKKWYNREILRSYIDSIEITNFINSYLGESRKPLLIYGDGARGKTTFLTAWKPLRGHKILVNCGADDSYSYWPIIARQIINSLKEYDDALGYPDIFLGASVMFQLMDSTHKNNSFQKQRLSSDFYFVTDSERESFRVAFVKWIKELRLKEEFTIVINDLNLLDDAKSKLLSWIPSSMPDKLSIICTTNDDDMIQTAELLGWNVKEIPLFDREGAMQLINEYLHSYGKNLSNVQFGKLMSSVVIKYPGQLRFLVMFLINYGRFDNLDFLVDGISKAREIGDVYQYVYEYLMKEYSSQEIKTIRMVLGLVHCCNISLSERECFQLSQKANSCTAIEWAHMCRFFEQFDIIKGDYWNIRNEELQKIVDCLLLEEERRLAYSLLGDYFFEQLKTDNSYKSALQNIRDNTAYAKECLHHYQHSKDWDKLVCVLSDHQVLYYLSKLDWHCVKSAWVNLFLYSDLDVSNYLLGLIKQYWNNEGDDKIVALKLVALLKEMGFNNRLNELYEIIGKGQIVYLDENRDLSEMLSDSFISIYNKMHEMKSVRNFRSLHKYTTDLLMNEKSYNNAELCQILFFKADAEEQLRFADECIKTTNDYFLIAIKAGLPYEMMRALSMRGNLLFRSAQNQDAMIVQKKVARVSLNEGKLREYLSALNIVGMCHYRMANYSESIAIFDKLISYWEKLSNSYEAGIIIMNRCNALYFSGNVQKALISAEEFYCQITDDVQLRRVCASLLGNMGRYASELKLYDKAEHYLLTAIEYSKVLGQESTLANAYHSLIELYIVTDNFIRIIELRKEQMEFFWDRHDYSSVMDALEKTESLLLQHKYISQANKLEKHWKEKFSAIPGGQKYFEQQIDAYTLDDVKIDKIKEEAIIAKSEGNIQREATLYYEIAKMLQHSNKDESTEYLLLAALLYKKAGDNDKYHACVEHSVILQFDQGIVRNDVLCKKVLKNANNENINRIVDYWKRLGKGIDTTNNHQSKKVFHSLFKNATPNIYELLCGLLTYISQFENLVVSCLVDISCQIVYSCTAEEMIKIVNEMPESNKKTIIYNLGLVMKENFEKNFATITRDYLSPDAIEKIEFYEKCIIFLKHFDNINVGAISGNLALIFRRRKEKDKTLYYHSISIEAYEKAKKKQDYLIEMMNMATAYYEFDEFERAVDMLRKSLQEAKLCKEDKLAASIAGNLASILMKSDDSENNDEILRCFVIEEKYFRSVGNFRDLAISLMNQIIYLHNKVDQNIWQPKLSEVSSIVRENNFKEFMPVLSKLEWMASKDQHTSDEEGELFVRKKFETLLSTNDAYSLSDIKLEGEGYHIVCSPIDEKLMGAEQLLILYDSNSHCKIQLYCIYRPSMYEKSNVAKVNEYIDWWNETGDYSLIFDESEHVLQTHTTLVASNWEGVVRHFNLFLKFWEVDKINTLTLLLGLLELPVCQGAKLKAINPDG